MGRCETLHCQLRVEIRTVREKLVMLNVRVLCQISAALQVTAGYCRIRLTKETTVRRRLKAVRRSSPVTEWTHARNIAITRLPGWERREITSLDIFPPSSPAPDTSPRRRG